MKLIVDISDETYELCKNGTTGAFLITSGMRSGKTFLISLYKAIANGTPLPKGHGRLIDINEITAFRELERNGHNVESLDEFTTIIEADKESEENE